ncbi:MAG: site-specific integrase [Coriobacteriia bacterium]
MIGKLRRRDGDSWQFRIPAGRDESGRYRYEYETIHAATRREAEAEQARIMHERATGTHVKPSKLTVGEYLESWLASCGSRVAPYTLDRYETIVRRHLIPAFGTVKLAQLGPERIERYYLEALQSGRLSGGELSARTVLHHHRVFRRALSRAVRLRYIPLNPCDAVDPPTPERKEAHAIDELATERLLAAAREESGHLSLYTAILLAANVGLRRGEVLGLRWSDVDLEGGALVVRETLQDPSSGLAFRQPKSELSRRRLALDAFTVRELKEYRIRQSQRRLELGPAWRDNGLVCPEHRGEPWRPSIFSQVYRRFCGRRGIHVRFHDLRHSHAAQLIAAGAPAKVIQERLGHSSAGFTLTTYGHLLPGMQAEAVDRVAERRAEARERLAAEG